jgi:hypothetical protein
MGPDGGLTLDMLNKSYNGRDNRRLRTVHIRIRPSGPVQPPVVQSLTGWGPPSQSEGNLYEQQSQMVIVW